LPRMTGVIRGRGQRLTLTEGEGVAAIVAKFQIMIWNARYLVCGPPPPSRVTAPPPPSDGAGLKKRAVQLGRRVVEAAEDHADERGVDADLAHGDLGGRSHTNAEDADRDRW